MSSLTISMIGDAFEPRAAGRRFRIGEPDFRRAGFALLQELPGLLGDGRKLLGAIADQILGRRMREQAPDKSLARVAAAAFERVIRLFDQPARRAFFFAAEKTFNIHCQHCPRTKARSFCSSLSQLPATVEGATPPLTRFCWPARPARLPHQGGEDRR